MWCISQSDPTGDTNVDKLDPRHVENQPEICDLDWCRLVENWAACDDEAGHNDKEEAV